MRKLSTLAVAASLLAAGGVVAQTNTATDKATTNNGGSNGMSNSQSVGMADDGSRPLLSGVTTVLPAGEASYRYYYTNNTYYSPETGTYYYQTNGTWTSGTAAPARLGKYRTVRLTGGMGNSTTISPTM